MARTMMGKLHGLIDESIIEAFFFFCPYRNHGTGFGHGTGLFCRQQRLLQTLMFLFLSGSAGCFLGLCTWQPQSFIPQTGIEH